MCEGVKSCTAGLKLLCMCSVVSNMEISEIGAEQSSWTPRRVIVVFFWRPESASNKQTKKKNVFLEDCEFSNCFCNIVQSALLLLLLLQLRTGSAAPHCGPNRLDNDSALQALISGRLLTRLTTFSVIPALMQQ